MSLDYRVIVCLFQKSIVICLVRSSGSGNKRGTPTATSLALSWSPASDVEVGFFYFL